MNYLFGHDVKFHFEDGWRVVEADGCGLTLV